MTHQDLPIITVEMKIQPLVRQMVCHMLLSDQEASDNIRAAAEQAIRDFNFQKEIQEAVKKEFSGLLSEKVHDMIRQISWNPAFEAGLKKKLAAMLLEPKESA